MAITLVQTVRHASALTNPVDSTFGSSVTAGNTVIVGIGVDSGATAPNVTVTDSKSNTYARILDKGSAGFGRVQLYYAFNVIGGSSFTVHANNPDTWDVGVVAREYSGLATTDPLDKSASAAGSSAAPNSGATATTSQADELVVGISADSWGTGQTYSLGSGYSNLSFTAGTNSEPAAEDKIVAATGAQTATFSLGSSTQWACGVATFKASSSSPTVSSPTLSLMGVG